MALIPNIGLSGAVKKRYDAFWGRTNTDRAIMHISVTGGGYEKPVHNNLFEQWESRECRLLNWEEQAAHTSYYAEGFPNAWINFGPGSLAAMIGGGYTFTPNTVWFGGSPAFLEDWADIDKIKFDPGSPMYVMTEGMTRHFLENSGGRYHVSMTDLGGNLDIVASLRDTQELLMDIYDNPDKIEKSIGIVDGLWEQAYTRLCDIMQNCGQEGTTAWIPIWCRERWYPLQCDFSAMISPDSFAEFVVPSLTRISEFLDHSVYHWDGPGEIPHLEHLLSIPSLDGIQWTPGDGSPPVYDDEWFPLYERIQRAGKNLVLFGEPGVEGNLKLLKNLSPEGLFISMRLGSSEEAEEVIAKAAEYAKR